MSLSTPPPPDAAADAFRNGLAAFLSVGPPNSEAFVGSRPPIPSLPDVETGGSRAVLQGFVLSLRDAATNTGVVSPAHAGWRFFAGGEQNNTVLGSVVHRRHGWKLVAVHYGDRVWETLYASQQINSSLPSQVQVEAYELRLLAIPGLNLEVFWLSSQKVGAVDLIFPVTLPPVVVTSSLVPAVPSPGFPSGLLEFRTFLAEIRPLAASLLMMHPGYGA
jgi:hypothetical protein